MIKVETNTGRALAASNKLSEIASPRSVECEIAAPIKAFFRAIIKGEMIPQVIDRNKVPSSAYKRNSYWKKSVIHELMIFS